MKKLFLLSALAALFFAVSCTKENMGSNGEEAVATLSVKLPEQSLTKAYGDGKLMAKNLIIGVFDENEAHGASCLRSLPTA